MIPAWASDRNTAFSVEPLLSLRVMRWDTEAGQRIPVTLTPCQFCKPEPVAS